MKKETKGLVMRVTQINRDLDGIFLPQISVSNIYLKMILVNPTDIPDIPDISELQNYN